MSAEDTCARRMGLCPEVVEHKIHIEGLYRAAERMEQRLDHLLYAILGALAASVGSLLVLLLKH